MKTKNTIASIRACLPLAAILGLLLVPRTSLATSISCGQSLTATTTSASEVDQYNFSGSAGQMMSFVLTWYDGYNGEAGTADIYNPSGQWVTNVTAAGGGNAVNFTLPSSGTYTILVHSTLYNVTSGYALSLQTLTGGGCDSTSITCGQTLTNSTKFDSEMDAYSYAGSAGQMMSFVLTWYDGYNGEAGTADIYNPSGQWVTNVTAAGGGNAVNFTLPSSGTYTILVHSTLYNVTSGYALSLQTLTGGGCNGITIPCGQTINGQISLNSQMNAYELVANAGEHVILSDTGSAGLVVNIYDPTGSNMVNIGMSTSTNYTFAAAGIYTLLVHSGSYAGTGSYGLTLTVFGGCDSLPTVSVTPTNLAAISGSPATFTAIVSGPAPLYYRWLFRTNPISGATNTTYNIAQMHTNNVGSYVVVVSNPGGAVTSAPPSFLSITGPPVTVNNSGTNVIFSWPTNYAAGFTLQTTTNLASGNWVTVTNPFTTIGTNDVVTNTISGNSGFFRLVQ